jgi:hypothetical protein
MDGIIGEKIPRWNFHGLRDHSIFRFAYLVNALKGQGIEVKYI